MPKLTFVCEHQHPLKKDVTVSTITYESNREYLDDILEDVRDFLKGCGFHIDGDIRVVKEETDDMITFDLSTPYSANMHDSVMTFDHSYDTITLGEQSDFSFDINRSS